MTLDDAVLQISRLSETLNDKIPEISFKFVKGGRSGLFKSYFTEYIPDTGINNKSGVYLILDEQNNVLYIGKATQNNFGAEIYHKFGTATQGLPEPKFENSPLAKYAKEDKYRSLLIQGDVGLGVFIIDPPELSSLIEVYLQTYCVKKEGFLPPLNKQIG